MEISEETPDDQLWSSILAQSGSGKKRRNQTVVLLGDRRCGKSTLTSSLEDTAVDSEDRGDGPLEYTFLDVKHSASAENVRLDIWTLFGDDKMAELLTSVATVDTIDSLMFLVCVDFAKPWEIPLALDRWLSVVKDHMEDLWEVAGAERKRAAMDEQVKFFKKGRMSLVTKPEEDKDDEEVVAVTEDDLPLESNVLTYNVGVPIIIVPTRTDILFSTGFSREYGLSQGSYDIVQQHVRAVALNYGAAVVYTNAESSKRQTQQLLDYMLHRFIDVPLEADPEDVNKESIFIPSGWDSQSKIDGISLGSKSISEEFLPKKKGDRERRVDEPEDFQAFLNKEKGRMDSMPKADPDQRIRRDEVEKLIYSQHKATVGGDAPAASSASAGGAAPSGGAAGGAGVNNKVAENFFKNILEGRGKAGAGGTAGAAARPGGGASNFQALMAAKSKKAGK